MKTYYSRKIPRSLKTTYACGTMAEESLKGQKSVRRACRAGSIFCKRGVYTMKKDIEMETKGTEDYGTGTVRKGLFHMNKKIRTFMFLGLALLLTGCSSTAAGTAETTGAEETTGPAGTTGTVAAEITFAQIDMVSESEGYAVNEDGHILKTEDGGETWTDVYGTGEPDGSPVICAVDGETVYALTMSGNEPVFLSTADAGATWTDRTFQLTAGWDEGDLGGFDISFADAENGWGPDRVDARRRTDAQGAL